VDFRDPLTAPIYESSAAAWLAQLKSSHVRRLLHGYRWEDVRGIEHVKEPVVHRAPMGRYASFLDLIELRFARAFLAEGFSPQKVRKAFDEAATVTGLDHPFARRRFFTSGPKIYLDAKGNRQAPNLLELFTGGQWAIGDVVNEYEKQIDFDPQSDAARRWYPLGADHHVMIDPRYAFGEPALKDRGTRTSNLYQLYVGEGRNAQAVARWMDIPVEEVEAALQFEREWSKQLAA
jgi:uncharacterized protein (DUF433 family)